MKDKSPVWIAMVDLFLCVLNVVIVAASPAKTTEGVKDKVEYLLSVEWDVKVDADVDIHLMGPSKAPTFYRDRKVGCATLDRDSRGSIDNLITLADGSKTPVDSDKETIAIRCIEPGHYDLGANLYAYREHNVPLPLGPVHVEILAMNPSVHVVYARDITLDRAGQTVNWASFDMARDGSIKLVEPPLAPITSSYQK